MRKIAIAFLLIVCSFVAYVTAAPGEDALANLTRLYHALQPKGEKPSFAAFSLAMKGYEKMKGNALLKNQKYLTIIDFTLSSTKKRMWIIDVANNSVAYNTYVAHGRNTGNEYAEAFSNIPNTNMSSLGFYLTGSTYHGKHGLSLYLDGLEKGFNDKARQRTIVMHGAEYATPAFIERIGRLGRSFGCPAIPPEMHKEIIEKIKDKSCLFIYFNDENYLKLSEFL